MAEYGVVLAVITIGIVVALTALAGGINGALAEGDRQTVALTSKGSDMTGDEIEFRSNEARRWPSTSLSSE